MKRKTLVGLILVILVIGVACVITLIQRSKARSALAAYKADLRAKGEKLSFEEAGYPFPLETNANLEHFVKLADQLRAKSTIPGNFNVMPFAAPGRAIVVWAGDPPKLVNANSDSPAGPSWAELESDMNAADALLSEIRAELEHPPRYFGWGYTNPFAANQPRNPFVQKRAAAQFLSADCLVALHAGDMGKAQADLHALTQLVQVHRSDPTLVSAMVRVAISGLALDLTWEALPAGAWDEAGLAALQQDWEAIDLLQAVEAGLAGERMFGEQAFGLVREADPEQQRGLMTPGTKSSLARLKDQIAGKGMMIYWRGHMDEDELLYLQYSQSRIDAVRRLQTNAGGASVQSEVLTQTKALERVIGSPLGKYRHLFSAIAIPNSDRAFESVIKLETRRRMTVVAIALKRYFLRHESYPEALEGLVPECIPELSCDPWSGMPFHYRLNADGTFLLYSVGEDGRDDGGDAAPDRKPQKVDFWTGKDSVWPEPVFPERPE